MKHIQQLHLLLVTLMAEGFPNRWLADNKKLMSDLNEFQSIVFDRGQRYGSPNYRQTPLEKDLKQMENQLAQVIYEQLLAIDISQIDINQLLEIHKDYRTFCYHREVYGDGKVVRAQSAVLSQMLIKAGELENKEEKIATFCFVINNSNGSNEEHIKAKELLKELDPVGCKF